MEIIKIKPQTVILFVGPKHCGKTYFAQNVLLQQLDGYNQQINKPLNLQLLSSDAFREDMLGHTYYPKPNDKLMSKHLLCSKQNLRWFYPTR